MSTSYAIANIQHILQALKDRIPPDQWSSTPLPVIAAPSWWIDEVRSDMGVDAGCEIGSIHDCSVIRTDDVTEPRLIDHDGKRYPILPKWQRAATSPAISEGANDA